MSWQLWNIPCGISRSQAEVLKGYCLVFCVPETIQVGTLRPIDISGLCEQRNINPRDIKEHFGASRLGYLAERPNVMRAEINWEEELSLGEKQRIAIARLIFPTGCHFGWYICSEF